MMYVYDDIFIPVCAVTSSTLFLQIVYEKCLSTIFRFIYIFPVKSFLMNTCNSYTASVSVCRAAETLR